MEAQPTGSAPLDISEETVRAFKRAERANRLAAQQTARLLDVLRDPEVRAALRERGVDIMPEAEPKEAQP